MSQQKRRTTSSKKKIKTRSAATRKSSTASNKRRQSRAGSGLFPNEPLLYNRKHYIIFGIGVALIAAGLLLMSGGSMPTPDVWDESVIYSFRRITLAPIVILSGFGVVIYGLFK